MKLISTLALMASLLSTAAMAEIPFSIFPRFAVGPYAGINGGYSTSVDPTIGANVGYDLGLLRFEADYDRLGLRNTSSNVVTSNAIVQLPFGALTPYAIGGLGYEWRNRTGYFADHSNWATGSGLWSVGGGMRYALFEHVDIDTRYRLMQPFSGAIPRNFGYNPNTVYHVLTTGLTIRF